MLCVALDGLASVDHDGRALRTTRKRRLRGDIAKEGAIRRIAVAECRYRHAIRTRPHQFAHVLHLPVIVRHGIDDLRRHVAGVDRDADRPQALARQAERPVGVAHEDLRARAHHVVLHAGLLEGLHDLDGGGEVPVAVHVVVLAVAEVVQLRRRHALVDLPVVRPREPAPDLLHAGIVAVAVADPALGPLVRRREAREDRLAYDFYKAGQDYINVRRSINWKESQGLYDDFAKEVEAFGDPTVTYSWMRNYGGKSSDERFEFVKKNASKLGKVRNVGFYSTLSWYMGGAMKNFVPNDYEYTLWDLFLNRSYDPKAPEKDEVYSELAGYLGGKYPGAPYLE